MKEQYGLIKQAEPQFPVRTLLSVPHKNRKLIVGYPAFGPDTYKENLEQMSQNYSHPQTGDKISFNPATTSESISASAYNFGSNGEVDAKRDIFDQKWLQAGYIVKTQDGVFTNIKSTDEKSLKALLNKAKKVNGIYLIDDKTAFAPYETFERGVQDFDTFAHGGLARALEHTKEKVATNQREIASPKFYKRGVNVWGFDNVQEPVLRVVCLNSDAYVGGDRLNVGGGSWSDDDSGYAFGVLKEEGK